MPKQVRLLTDGLFVSSIRWKIEEHRLPNFRDSIKKDPCVYCNRPSESWEHIQPRSKDGKDGWSNIARACLRHNRQRDVQPFLIYMLKRFNKRKVL